MSRPATFVHFCNFVSYVTWLLTWSRCAKLKLQKSNVTGWRKQHAILCSSTNTILQFAKPGGLPTTTTKQLPSCKSFLMGANTHSAPCQGQRALTIRVPPSAAFYPLWGWLQFIPRVPETLTASSGDLCFSLKYIKKIKTCVLQRSSIVLARPRANARTGG